MCTRKNSFLWAQITQKGSIDLAACGGPEKLVQNLLRGNQSIVAQSATFKRKTTCCMRHVPLSSRLTLPPLCPVNLSQMQPSL